VYTEKLHKAITSVIANGGKALCMPWIHTT